MGCLHDVLQYQLHTLAETRQSFRVHVAARWRTFLFFSPLMLTPMIRIERLSKVAEWVRASTGDQTIDGSTPTAGDFEFGTLAIPLTLLCQCLSDETLKAVGPFYLVSMPGELKDPTSPHWNVSLANSTSHSKSPVCEYAALDAALHSIRILKKKVTKTTSYIIQSLLRIN